MWTDVTLSPPKRQKERALFRPTASIPCRHHGIPGLHGMQMLPRKPFLAILAMENGTFNLVY